MITILIIWRLFEFKIPGSNSNDGMNTWVQETRGREDEVRGPFYGSD